MLNHRQVPNPAQTNINEIYASQIASIERGGHPDMEFLHSPHSCRQLEPETQVAPVGAWREVRRTATELSAVKSKATKPLAVLHSIAERLGRIPETNIPGASSRIVSRGHTGLETPAPTSIKADPHLPDDSVRRGIRSEISKPRS